MGDKWSPWMGHYFESFSTVTRHIQRRNGPFQCGSTDMDCVLIHVKVEGSLSISVLENRATHFQKLELKTEEFSKVYKWFNHRH